jgi:predicted RNA binding protein YcfA (HicA-like mRNA interferase family)
MGAGAGNVETNSRKLMRMLVRDGWVLERVRGDHHTFKHPKRAELISLTHPRKDLPVGQVRSIYRLAGWKP